MEFSVEAIDDDVTKVVLVGRMDHKGASAIDTRLSVIAGSKRKVIFDLHQVSFLASMGIRSLVMSAKTIKAKGGLSILLSPEADVENVLVMSSIDTLIPIFHDQEEALAALRN